MLKKDFWTIKVHMKNNLLIRYPVPEKRRPLCPWNLMKNCIIGEPQQHDIREIIELDVVKQELRLQRQQFNRLQMMIVLPIKDHF